jgi:hypothetical protein
MLTSGPLMAGTSVSTRIGRGGRCGNSVILSSNRLSTRIVRISCAAADTSVDEFTNRRIVDPQLHAATHGGTLFLSATRSQRVPFAACDVKPRHDHLASTRPRCATRDSDRRVRDLVRRLSLFEGWRCRKPWLESGASKPSGSILAAHRAIRTALMCHPVDGNPHGNANGWDQRTIPSLAERGRSPCAELPRLESSAIVRSSR